MSLIEKIDAEIAESQKNYNESLEDIWFQYYQGRIDLAEELKQLILSEQKEPLTIGGKMRESNKSLAKIILGTGSICDYCSLGNNAKKCGQTGCTKGVLDYLNQPYTETN